MIPGIPNSNWMVARERQDARFEAAEKARLAQLAKGDAEAEPVLSAIRARLRRVVESLPRVLWPISERPRLFGPRDGLA